MAFACPRCGATSHHPLDEAEGYCGACHDWTAPERRSFLGLYDKQGRPMSMRQFNDMLGDMAYKHVAVTAIGDDVEVSTVWLGADHNFGPTGPPLIFETMVF